MDICSSKMPKNNPFMSTTTDTDNTPPKIKWLDNVSAFLDNQFRIPGTETRFGLDFIIGLIPGAGDVASFGISSVLVLTMVRYGASGRVILQMLWNILLDTTVGAIPILGDIFDLYFKSNRRNFELLKKHYGEGAYQGNGLWIVIMVLILLVALFIGVIYLVGKVVAWSWDYLASFM